MEDIQNIVRVLTSKKLKRLPDVASTGSQDDLVHRFYKYCLEGKYQTDEEAASDLYTADPSDNRYRVLKSRLKHRLIEDLIHCSFNHVHPLPYTPFVIESQKTLVGLKMLISFGIKHFAISEVRRLLSKATTYTATEIELECFRLLKEYYWFKGDKKEYENYANALRKAVQRYEDELRAEELHELLAFPFTVQKQAPEDLIKVSSIYKHELDSLRKRTRTYRLQIAYFRFNILYAQIHRHYFRVIHTCGAFETFLESTEVIATESQLAECAISKAEAQLFIRNYPEALQSIEKALVLFPRNGMNWYLAQSIHFIILMHLDRLSEAGELLQEVMNSTVFAKATESYREEWRIYEAYYKYVRMAGSADDAQKQAQQANFYLYKFLNEVPIFSQDKKGANISILILEILWLLEEKNFHKLLEIQKSIENYMTRYLRDKESRSRSAIFLNMLLVLIRGDFQFEKIERKIQPLLVKLSDTPLDPPAEPLEVYPFDKLWTRVLDRCK